MNFGAGDLFESREFVREFYEFYKPDRCEYAHGKIPSIIKDMDFIAFVTFDPSVMNSMKPFHFTGTELYVNTWIGRDGKFVLPGIGCTVEMLYSMYNELMMMMQTGYKLQKQPLDYIPRIDFDYYDTNSIDLWLLPRKSREKVLISNGAVQSGQADNFDFTPAIAKLCDTFPEQIFIVTSPVVLDRSNLFCTSDIICNITGCDLNEIAYLSRFCKLIVGRNSGPHVFAQNLDNWEDPSKTCLSFTYQKQASHFVLDDTLPMKKEWSNVTSTDDIFNKIGSLI